MDKNEVYRLPDYDYRKYQKTPNKPELGIVRTSLKAITKEYCEESSIGGLKHLVNENTPYFERIIWIITMVGSLVVSISLVWITFMAFFLAPLVTTQMPEGKRVTNIIFPAVGICTNNRMSKRAVEQLAKSLVQEERNKKYNEDEMVSMLFGLGQLYDLRMDTNYSAMQLHDALGHYQPNDLIRKLTPQCEDLLVRCSWNDDPMNCSKLFDFRLTMNGYCCTFNYLRETDFLFEEKENTESTINMYQYGNKSAFDYDQGLKVLIRLEENDDFYYNIPLKGAQLQFSDAYDFPDSPSGSFGMQMINPNVQMTVLVTATITEASRDILHVPLSLRKCMFYDESSYLAFYTYSDCMLKCRMLFLLEKCNCTPFNIPRLANSRTCDLTDIPCLKIYFAQSVTVRPYTKNPPAELELDLVGGGVHCPMCYPTCSKTAYNYYFYNVKIYPELLNLDQDADRDNWLCVMFIFYSNFHDIRRRGVNLSSTSIVQIRYGRDFADCYGQNVIMKWFDLISNIGSTCGFVTGFSFVSVLEFFYFYIVKLLREIRRRKEKVYATTTFSHSARFESLSSKNTPIYWKEIAPSTYNVENKLIQIKS